MQNANARKNNLAKIHIAKKQLGLDDDTYRAVLQAVAGKQSAKDLTLAEQLRVLAHFEQRGFKAQRPRTAAKKAALQIRLGKRPHTFDMPERQPLFLKIEALLISGGYTWAYANGIAKKVCKTQLAWCDPPRLRKIAAALTYNAKRQAAKKQVNA